MAKKKNKDNLPSKEDASSAMNFIKEKQAENNSIDPNEKLKKELELKEKERQIAEQKLLFEIQSKIKRKLRENLKKKKQKEKKEFIIKELESGNRISWISKNNGHILKGFLDNNEIFEIKRGLNLFSLYLKKEITIKEIVILENNKKLTEKKIGPSYLACSTNLSKLKIKSEKLIQLINLTL